MKYIIRVALFFIRMNAVGAVCVFCLKLTRARRSLGDCRRLALFRDAIYANISWLNMDAGGFNGGGTDSRK